MIQFQGGTSADTKLKQGTTTGVAGVRLRIGGEYAVLAQ
jgi:hypothetical protein